MRHAVLSRGWESSSFSSRQIHRCVLVKSCLSVFGLPLGLGVSVATLGQVHHEDAASVAIKSLPGHVQWQRAGVTSEAALGLSS